MRGSMLEFRACRFELGARFYLLLPRLNSGQMAYFERELSSEGFAVSLNQHLLARKGGQTIRVFPTGYCRSNADPGDVMLPLIPDMLRVEKETMPLGALRESYFRFWRSGGLTYVRLLTRLECSPLWYALRESGLSGLTADELRVAVWLGHNSIGKTTLITDFPVEGSRLRIKARRAYYESSIRGQELESTLAAFEHKGPRNSYLPRSGILHFDSIKLPAPNRQLKFFQSLGEWCGFQAA